MSVGTVALRRSTPEHAVSSAGSMAKKERLGNLIGRFMAIIAIRSKCLTGFSRLPYSLREGAPE